MGRPLFWMGAGRTLRLRRPRMFGICWMFPSRKTERCRKKIPAGRCPNNVPTPLRIRVSDFQPPMLGCPLGVHLISSYYRPPQPPIAPPHRLVPCTALTPRCLRWATRSPCPTRHAMCARVGITIRPSTVLVIGTAGPTPPLGLCRTPQGCWPEAIGPGLGKAGTDGLPHAGGLNAHTT